MISCILFGVAETTYAISTEAVRQLEMVGTVTPLPTALPYVKGVTSIRGEVLPVVCLRSRLGIPESELELRKRLLVVEHGERVVAILVDSARDFIRLDEGKIEPPPKDLDANLVSGIYLEKERPILFLDLATVLDGKSLI